MTAIVAHRDGWMVADTRGTANTWLVPVFASKIIKFGSPQTHTLVAACGIHGFGQVVNRARRNGMSFTNNPDEVIEDLCTLQRDQQYKDNDNSRSVVAVTNTQRLVVIDMMGLVTEVDKKFSYWCMGSGDELCLGFLRGLTADPQRKRAGDISAIDAVHAIRFASEHLLCVSPESTTEYLG